VRATPWTRQDRGDRGDRGSTDGAGAVDGAGPTPDEGFGAELEVPATVGGAVARGTSAVDGTPGTVTHRPACGSLTTLGSGYASNPLSWPLLLSWLPSWQRLAWSRMG
jgi:hypothetical protein